MHINTVQTYPLSSYQVKVFYSSKKWCLRDVYHNNILLSLSSCKKIKKDNLEWCFPFQSDRRTDSQSTTEK